MAVNLCVYIYVCCVLPRCLREFLSCSLNILNLNYLCALVPRSIPTYLPKWSNKQCIGQLLSPSSSALLPARLSPSLKLAALRNMTPAR